jgi:ABC-type bacteriocin/lantibiotic exporter with double-glycine peptidase domain/CRP-like cAMP-binding protein
MSISEQLPEGAAAILEGLPVLKLLPADSRRLVVEAFVPVSYGFGEVIVAEGDDADAFYVIVSGSARALRRGDRGEEVSLGSLGPGDAFGEIALLEDGDRTATVRASGEVEALRLDKAIFRAFVQVNPEIKEHFERHIGRVHLRDLFRLSSAFADIDPDTLDALIEAVEPLAVDRGEIVVRQGETASSMFFVEQGRLRAVWQTEEGSRGDVAYIRRGDFFGERSLLLGAPRAVSIEAVTPAKLLVLQEPDFRRLLESDAGFRAVVNREVARYEFKFVSRVPLDFAEELVPAEASVAEPVGLDQVDAPAAAEAAVEEWGAEEGGRAKRIRRFPHVWQVDEMDCGAACLAMVTRHFGRPVSLAHIRRLVHTSIDGTSLAGIASGAEQVGLRVRSVKASKTRLDELPLPAVCHFDGNHWVVLYRVEDKLVRLADPARGLVKMDRAEFEEKWSGYSALLAYGEGLEQAPIGDANVDWIWDFFRPFKRTLVWAGVLALVAAALEMVLPVFTKVIFDNVLVHRDYGLLYLLLGGMGAVLAAVTGATLIQRYILSKAAVVIDGKSLDFLTGKLLQLPMSYFHSRRTGDIQRRLQGMRQVRTFVVQQGVQGLTALATLIASVTLMFIFDWVLALVFLATAPVYLYLMRFSRRRLRPMFDSLEEAFGKYSAHQIDAIKGIETVKAASGEHAFRSRMLEQFQALSRRVFRADFTIMSYEAAIQLVSIGTLMLFLFVGSLRVLSGAMELGELAAFQALVLLANGPILSMLSIWDELQYSSVLLNRLNDIVTEEPEQGRDRDKLTAVPSLEGRIRIENLGFRYTPISPPILEGVTLDVEPGTMVAIVGRSGGGKTTLVRCLAGLLEPTEGTIYFDGVDMRTLDYRHLRKHIGYVLQENHLFDDTIARNIAFGDEQTDMRRILWAAKVANAHDFVERLPLGYETRIGETGLLLSGGQRQRIAISRAVYGRPPVLVFDEATSALDSESERAVQANMDEVIQGRTSFVIAHRLSTIRDADLIIVLERGRLVEQGSHEELMKRQGIYYYLVGQQLGL